MPFRRLDPTRIQETAEQIALRVEERFPKSGLSQIAKEVAQLSRDTTERVRYLETAHYSLRCVSILLALLILLGGAALLWHARTLHMESSLSGFLQMADAGANLALVLFAALFASLSLESRAKRRRALDALKELRALAHVIDLHQLSKDPSRLGEGEHDTPSSPRRNLDRFHLVRYLDYCSELVSVLSKIAAVYTRSLSDSTVLESADSLEILCVGISRKLWQKIAIAT